MFHLTVPLRGPLRASGRMYFSPLLQIGAPACIVCFVKVTKTKLRLHSVAQRRTTATTITISVTTMTLRKWVPIFDLSRACVPPRLQSTLRECGWWEGVIIFVFCFGIFLLLDRSLKEKTAILSVLTKMADLVLCYQFVALIFGSFDRHGAPFFFPREIKWRPALWVH